MNESAVPTVLEVVRGVARRRPRGGALAALVASSDRDWRAAEAALEAEILRSPRRAARLVSAFGVVAAASTEAEASGRAERLAGAFAVYRGEFEAALPRYAAAAARLRGAARDGARLGRASALLRLGRFDEAREACRAVRRAARRRGDVLLASAADLNDGVALHESGHTTRAVSVYRRALDGLTSAGHAHLAATAAQNLANALVLLDRWDEAEPYYERAEQGFAALHLHHEAARCDVNRGALLSALDRLGDADEVLYGAERRLRAEGDRVQAALARLDRGEVLLRAGLVPEALHTLEGAKRALVRGAQPGERRRAALALARAHLVHGDPSSASTALRGVAAATTAERAAVDELGGHALAARGRLAAARERLESAAAGFGRARPGLRCRALVAAGRCAVREGDVRGARKLLRMADRVAGSLALPRHRFAVAALRFDIERTAARRSAADSALQDALDALERVRDGLRGDAQRAALVEGREEFLAHAIRHRLEGPDGARRALALLERFRGRALRELTEEAARVVSTDSDVEGLRARVAALEAALGERAMPALLRGGVVRGHGRTAHRLATAERALQRAIDRRSGAASKPLALTAISERLSPEAPVVSVFSDEHGTCLFVVRPEAIEVVHVPVTREQLAALVDTLHFRLSRFTAGVDFVTRHAGRLARDTDDVLRRIAEAFVAPLRHVLEGAEALSVIPSGPWNHVPFAALPYRSGRLIEALPITLTPSLALLDDRLPRARGAPVVVGFADADAPSIADEAHAVSGVLPRARRLVGADATYAELTRRRRPACLHVAAHGRHRADAPMMSGVRIADGWLRAADLTTLDLRGSLLVLSGCETGVSSVGAADEVHGLVRAAFAAGARDLVASLWTVGDASTAELMLRFHEVRRSGLRPAAALAHVQAEQAASGRHPWFWAGFSAWSRASR
jgi:tetratricopeptide (TPR) repeat protein